jgi:hypothetical protein
MKAILLGVAIASILISTAAAETCGQLAENCMKQGGSRDRCYGPAFTGCKKTGTYIGSNSGKTFQARLRSGSCPAGTCAEDGGPDAKDVKNCSAKYCREQK